jgi:hypothetical protein
MIFEVGDLKFNAPLDPTKGRRYVEPTRGGSNTKELDNLYNMNAWMDEYVNATIEGVLS